MKGKIWLECHFYLFGLRAILCNSFAMFCIMRLADQPCVHGYVSKLLCFLAGSSSGRHWQENETEEREKAGYFCCLLSHASPWLQLMPGSPLAVDQAPDEQSHLQDLVMIPAYKQGYQWLLVTSLWIAHLHMLCLFSPLLLV